MKIKRLLVLASVFSVLLNLALVSVVGACEEPPPPPPETGTIIVRKFDDVNGNGVQDEGEMGIEGWLIRLYMVVEGNLVPYREELTGPDGTVTFEAVPVYQNGTSNWVWYKVWEEARLCWMPTFPDPDSLYQVDGGYAVLTRLDAGIPRSITFGNTDTCAEFDGCTPGGWQGGNLRWRWDELSKYAPDLGTGDADWNPAYENPFSHDTVFGTFFTPSGNTKVDDLTMFDLVSKGGGKDDERKAARSLVAAYLNARHADVNYPATEDELEDMWLTAVTSGEFLDLHKTLDEWNNLGCSVE